MMIVAGGYITPYHDIAPTFCEPCVDLSDREHCEMETMALEYPLMFLVLTSGACFGCHIEGPSRIQC